MFPCLLPIYFYLVTAAVKYTGCSVPTYLLTADHWPVTVTSQCPASQAVQTSVERVHIRARSSTPADTDVDTEVLLVRERSALSDPYCHLAWMSVAMYVCMSGTLRSNSSKAKAYRGRLLLGDYRKVGRSSRMVTSPMTSRDPMTS